MAEGLTLDSLFNGTILLEQAANGYRFNVDSALLAAFARQLPARRILDACAGNGVVGISVAHAQPNAHLTLIEIQGSLAARAQNNVQRNGLEARATVIHGDLRTFKGHGAHFDLALMNPPYFTVDEGQTSPQGERATARHQLHGSLESLVSAVHRHLLPQSWLVSVFPTRRLPQLLAAYHAVQRHKLLIQPIYPRAGQDAQITIVAARSSRSPELRLLPPLILHESDAQVYTEETARILRTGSWEWNSSTAP